MKTVVQLLLVIALFTFASTASAVEISGGAYDGVGVGGVDTFLRLADKDLTSIYYTMPDSSPESETDWVNSVLSPTTVTFSIKEGENVPYYSTDTANVFAYHLVTPPVTEYFLLKNATYWALFANIDEMDWAVFDSTDLPGGMNLPGEEYTISHVSRFDAAAPVPEPSTLLLLGAGIAGLAAYRRKKN